jgi:uncharacterized SAM-binding protein YcdF (DUF218 family)
MFDLPTCKRPFTQYPLFFDWGELNWIRNLIIVFILILLGLAIRWIVQQPRCKRWLSKRTNLVLLTAVTASLLILLSVADKGLTLFIPADNGRKADAIVILGRGTEFGILRTEVVAKLWQAKRSPLVFHSGMGDTPRALPLLEKKGIPRQALDGENCSMTTPENAIFTAAILKQRGIKNIILVTDAPHMQRSILDYTDEGFQVIPILSPIPNNMSFMDKSFFTFREYLFLTLASIRRVFHGERPHNLDTPELAKLVQQAKEYGKQQRLP